MPSASSAARLFAITELLNAIVQYLVQPSDLGLLRLASRRWNDLVIPFVYRSLHLDFAQENFPKTLKSISPKGILRPYVNLVQEVSVTFGNNAFSYTPEPARSKEFRYRCVIVVELLQTLPSLQLFR